MTKRKPNTLHTKVNSNYKQINEKSPKTEHLSFKNHFFFKTFFFSRSQEKRLQIELSLTQCFVEKAKDRKKHREAEKTGVVKLNLETPVKTCLKWCAHLLFAEMAVEVAVSVTKNRVGSKIMPIIGHVTI